jgi:hypothetical protein
MAEHPRPARRRSGHSTATRCVIPQTRCWAGAATPTQRSTTHALDRARRASDVINISNFTSEDNPHWTQALGVRPPPPIRTRVAERARGRSPAARLGDIAVRMADRIRNLAVGRVLVNWLASTPRRLCDQLFQMNDAEAYWHGWQITRVRGGIGRRYRDAAFDTLTDDEAG